MSEMHCPHGTFLAARCAKCEVDLLEPKIERLRAELAAKDAEIARLKNERELWASREHAVAAERDALKSALMTAERQVIELGNEFGQEVKLGCDTIVGDIEEALAKLAAKGSK